MRVLSIQMGFKAVELDGIWESAIKDVGGDKAGGLSLEVTTFRDWEDEE